MYKRSEEPRFVKKREALQRAFIDLTLEKKSTRITVKELTERAGVNRMTFYSHYDEVSDVLLEFLDGLTERIMEPDDSFQGMSIKGLLGRATSSMQEEIGFYRLVARDEGFESYRASFRKAFTVIFSEELARETALRGTELDLMAGMLASGITYAYLDWLAGAYGDMALDELITFCERFAADQMRSMGLQA